MKVGKMVNEVILHLGRKPATVRYPFEKIEMPEGYRGRIIYEAGACTGCRLCEKDCPAFAIEIIEVGEKQFVARIHYDRCIYCAQCVESCHKNALSISAEYELAEVDPIVLPLTAYELF